MEVCPKIARKCPSTHPCIPAVRVWILSHIPVILVQAVQKGYLLPRLPLPPYLSLCQPQPGAANQGDLPIRRASAPRVPMATASLEVFCCLLKLWSQRVAAAVSLWKIYKQRKKGKRIGEGKKKFTPGRRERGEKMNYKSHTLARESRENLGNVSIFCISLPTFHLLHGWAHP